MQSNSSLIEQSQSQADANMTADQFVQESHSSRSGSFSGIDTPTKKSVVNDFSFNSSKNFYPPSLSQVLGRTRASPSPSRASTESRIQGPYLNKNVSVPVPSFDAFIQKEGQKGAQIFYLNDQSSKLGAQLKSDVEAN